MSLNIFNGIQQEMKLMHIDMENLREDLKGLRADIRPLVKALNDNTRELRK